jgi:hypothetical protein
MKVEILLNGTTKIVLIPENDIEKAILDNVGKNEVMATTISQHTAILDKVVQEGLVIAPKVNRNESVIND